MHWFWLIMLVVFLMMEAVTSALVSLWFIGGSLAALLATLFDAPEWLQLVLFVAVSGILLLTLRPMAKKIVNTEKLATNARSNIGRLAVVTETIDELRGKGAVQISGVPWSARSSDGEIIEEGSIVRVTDISGAKVFVEKETREAKV